MLKCTTIVDKAMPRSTRSRTAFDQCKATTSGKVIATSSKSTKSSQVEDANLPKTMVKCTTIVDESMPRSTRSRTTFDQCKVGIENSTKACPGNSELTMAQRKSKATNDGVKSSSKPRVLELAKCAPIPKVGQIYLAKVRGYCEWPGSCIRIENRTAIVEFFGANPDEKM